MTENLEFILHKIFKFRFNLDLMTVDNLEIILQWPSRALKIHILNRKALATLLPLFSIVCAFATRLLPIVCSKTVTRACRFENILVNQGFLYKIFLTQLKRD